MASERTRTSGDWLPSNRAARVAMAKKWIEVLGSRGTDWKFTSQETAALMTLSSNSASANAAAQDGSGNRVLIAKANEASRALADLMRRYHARFRALAFVDSDWLSLGLDPRDTIRTDHTVVLEKIAYTIQPGAIREIVIHFQILGVDHRAKPEGYDGAVVVWAVGEFPFVRVEDLRDGHEIASRTPHTLRFTDDQRGKTATVALCWQNERGIRGEWSEILNTVIP